MHSPNSSLILHSFAAALLVLPVMCLPGQAAVVYHDPADIAIPANFAGVYLDFDDSSDPSDFTTGTSAPGPGGAWDINLFFGGIAIGNSDTFRPVTDTSPTINADVLNLSLGDTVGPVPTVGTYPAGTSGSTGHMGTGTNEFPGGQLGYIGFRLQADSFTTNSTGVHYGYMAVTLESDGSAGAVHWWAWETTPDTAVTVTVIPEPSVISLVGLGMLGLAACRRRKISGGAGRTGFELRRFDDALEAGKLPREARCNRD